MERTWGPINGFYFAAYATPIGDDGRWASYVKVCWKEPDNYWEADCAFKLFGGEQHGSPEMALAEAARKARNITAQLPPQIRTMPIGRRLRGYDAVPQLLAMGRWAHGSA